MQKLQNTFLVLAFSAFLVFNHAKAKEETPPLLSSSTQVALSTNQVAAVKTVDVKSGSGKTVAVITDNKSLGLNNNDENILLLKSVLFHNGNLQDSIRYIGIYSDISEQFNPNLYYIIAGMSPLDYVKHSEIRRFLQTNFKTEYLSSEMFDEQNSHLAKPIYMSEVVDWAYGAIATNNISVLRVLLDNYNFLFTIQNNDGYGLLSYAILHSRNDIAYMLIYRGANLNEENKYNAQPINIAARTNNIEAVKMLLDNGCDIDHQDAFGKTSFDYALMNNNNEMYNYLLSFKHT